MRTIEEVLNSARGMLKESSPSPRLDAEILLSAVTGLGRASLISRSRDEIESELEKRFFGLVTRRTLHEPVAYITGKKEFFGLEFFVNRHVLIPRPETELVVEAAIPLCYENKTPSLVLDIGTGSGCISVALGTELKKFKKPFHVIAIDKDDEALKVAQQNIDKHHLTEDISTIKSNWFDALSEFEGKFDLIVANPPYVASGDSEVSPETVFEPQHALYSGEEGLDDIRFIISNCRKYLKPNGAIVCEMGSDQREAIQEICDDVFSGASVRYTISFSKDLAGLDRTFEVTFS